FSIRSSQSPKTDFYPSAKEYVFRGQGHASYTRKLSMSNQGSAKPAVEGTKFDPLSHLQIMLPILIGMLEAQSGKPIPEGQGWKNDRQFLAKKFLYHLRTLLRTAEGEKITYSEGEHSFVDHATINIIARALLENFIVFEWVFGAEEESLSYFRYLTWVLAGLRERTDTSTLTEASKKKQLAERARCEKLCEDIKANKHFLELSKGAQKALLLGKWRMGRSVEEIAQQVGFHSRQLDGLYSYLCSYSHSSYISALQIGQADEPMERELSRMSIGVSCNMTARMIKTYARLFPDAQQVFESSTAEDKRAVERWNFLREDFEMSYGPDIAKVRRAWKDGHPDSTNDSLAGQAKPAVRQSFPQ
ncbi:DUF5677 domain-containing protein, partial [Polaromonas aquatica]